MPAYDPTLTPTYYMGVIPETFRKQEGVVRSEHLYRLLRCLGGSMRPDRRRTSRGLMFFGERSPLARVYDLDGRVLLLGVGHGNNTSLHIAGGTRRHSAANSAQWLAAVRGCASGSG